MADLSPHHLSLNSSYVLNCLQSCKGGCIHYGFLSIPFPYWDCWRNPAPAALELPQRSCSLVFTGDAFQITSDSVFRGGSHQHLALVVHHHPTIISQWLSQSITQHGQMDSVLSGAKELWIFWYNDKSQDLSSLVVP